MTERTVTSVGYLIGLEAALLWLPDHQPPEGWSRQRSGSIYRRLLKAGTSRDQLDAAIRGLAILKTRGDLPWLTGKPTARCLYHTHSGAVDVMALAVDAWYRSEPTPPTPVRGGFRPARQPVARLASLLTPWREMRP